ncbi:MAG TPA: hypothetical protein VHQ01_09100, partial [Pyrinomonadaceae bacterium]|nr:hypothetical protein [Pyrinomonadaceae bacterium]
MNTRLLFAITLGLAAGAMTFAQPPGRPEGGPPRNGQMRPGGDGPQNGRPPKDDWMRRLDANGDGKLDAAELQSAIETSFKAWDKNGNGVIDAEEMPRPPHPPRPNGPPMGQGDRPQGPPQAGQPDDKLLPPFFFADRNPEGAATSRADLEKIVKSVFAEMDKNGDGLISGDEARPPRREGGPQGPPEAGAPPNGKFIAAELRFGDKMVKGQPFSAETVIEDTRRLYDGTTVTKQNKGAFYRDGAGRTRREQPLEMVGGVSIAGTDGKPQMLVFINDFAAHTQYFLDPNHKVAHKNGIGGP